MADIFKDSNSDEWFFSKDAYILSETDEKGIIIYANDIFCKLADYKQEELVGEAHNIVRHSDMPKVAFEGLWNDVRSKGFWTGIVKNQRKDGGFYWVYATVLRKIAQDGSISYLSIRRTPDRVKVEECIALYSKLKEDE